MESRSLIVFCGASCALISALTSILLVTLDSTSVVVVISAMALSTFLAISAFCDSVFSTFFVALDSTFVADFCAVCKLAICSFSPSISLCIWVFVFLINAPSAEILCLIFSIFSFCNAKLESTCVLTSPMEAAFSPFNRSSPLTSSCTFCVCPSKTLLKPSCDSSILLICEESLKSLSSIISDCVFWGATPPALNAEGSCAPTRLATITLKENIFCNLIV